MSAAETKVVITPIYAVITTIITIFNPKITLCRR